MKILTPHVLRISNPRPGKRDSRAVFVRKHNLDVNVEAIKGESRDITQVEAPKWLFIVEGYRKYNALENLFLDDFIETLDIKAEDPIINPFTKEIAESASVDKTLASLSALVFDYVDLMSDNHGIAELDNSALERLFNLRLDEVGKAFDVRTPVLKREFLKLKWHDEEKLSRQLIALSEKRKVLIKEGNIKSEIKLNEVLESSEQLNLFIMTGIEHATIFTH